MKEVTPLELKAMQDSGEDFQLIDVREQNEYDFTNLGGELIPLGTITDNTDKISKEKKVVIMCRSGGRSGNAVMQLESRFQFDNLYNLKGGILGYSDDVDPSIPKY